MIWILAPSGFQHEKQDSGRAKLPLKEAEKPMEKMAASLTL